MLKMFKWLKARAEAKKFKIIGSVSGRVNWSDREGGVDYQVLLFKSGTGKRKFEVLASGHLARLFSLRMSPWYIQVKRWSLGSDADGVFYNPEPSRPQTGGTLRLVK